MCIIRKTLAFILVLFCSSVCVFSQTSFNEIIEDELYAGKRSVVNGSTWKNSVAYRGHRFLGDKHWKTGDVVFNGKRYTNLQLNYDIVEDDLILYDEQDDNIRYINVNKRFLEEFSYEESGRKYTFIYSNFLSPSQKEIMEVRHVGPVSLYVKHRKDIRKQIGPVYMGTYYVNTQLYLKKDNKMYHVRNKKSILSVLGNEKELKKYARSKALNIDKHHPNHIVQLLVYNERFRSQQSLATTL